MKEVIFSISVTRWRIFVNHQQNKKLPCHRGKDMNSIDVSSIIYCEAEGAYTKVFIKEKPMLISRTLGDVEELLPPDLFQRIHHSTLINVSYISQFLRSDVRVCYFYPTVKNFL